MLIKIYALPIGVSDLALVMPSSSFKKDVQAEPKTKVISRDSNTPTIRNPSVVVSNFHEPSISESRSDIESIINNSSSLTSIELDRTLLACSRPTSPPMGYSPTPTLTPVIDYCSKHTSSIPNQPLSTSLSLNKGDYLDSSLELFPDNNFPSLVESHQLGHSKNIVVELPKILTAPPEFVASSLKEGTTGIDNLPLTSLCKILVTNQSPAILTLSQQNVDINESKKSKGISATSLRTNSISSSLPSKESHSLPATRASQRNRIVSHSVSPQLNQVRNYKSKTNSSNPSPVIPDKKIKLKSSSQGQ